MPLIIKRWLTELVNINVTNNDNTFGVNKVLNMMFYLIKRLINRVLQITLVVSLGAVNVYAESASSATIYVAKTVITMDAANSKATAVAVQAGKIVGVGSLDELQSNSTTQLFQVNRRFENKVLIPGLIDNHIHPSMAALLLPMEFITPFDWRLPGKNIIGVQGAAAYNEKLKALEAEKSSEDEWLITWGYHHYFHGELSKSDLDAISKTRPIVVWHRSFHEIIFNTAALKALNFSADSVADHPHINFKQGHFYETALLVAFEKLAPKLLSPEWFGQGMETVKASIHKGGVTTIADMAAGMFNMDVEWPYLKQALDSETTPFRTLLIPSAASFGGVPGDEQSMASIAKLPKRNSDKLTFVKQIKLLADGAFFSQLMQMKAPGYLDGHKGEWLMEPELLERAARAYWQAGYQLHIHSNGDKGTEVVLDIVEKLQKEMPNKDHRTTLHHLGYSTEEQSKKMADLGVLVSANPYYLYSMGDKYSEIGLGPKRASEIVRAGSLIKNGVSLSLHSDFTMAPVEPLTLAWVAANRMTVSGKVMAPEQKISVEQALRAVTIDAAFAIQMEDKVGSIEVGKKADFTVLEQNPLITPAEKLKDIVIWGTVFEGTVFPIETSK